MVKGVTVEEQRSKATEEFANALLAEADRGYREWEVEGKKYRTKFPNSEDEYKANWEYSRAFNEGLRAGLPTRKEMEKILRERGIFSEEDEKRIDELRDKISSVEAVISKKSISDKSKTMQKLVAELIGLRAELLDLNRQIQEFMVNTVEYKADEVKAAYLISAVTLHEDGSRVWESDEKFMQDDRRELVNMATYEYTTFSMGLMEDYLDLLPEVQYLKAGVEDDAEPAG